MKTLTLILTTFILSATTFAQIAHDVEIYSENRKKFTLTMNGRLLNEEPAERVEVRNIQYDNVRLIINFEDEGIENIEDDYLSICNQDLSQRDKPVINIFRIKEKKGKYKLRLDSRFNKKVQNTTIIINQGTQGTQETNGVTISNGKVVINW